MHRRHSKRVWLRWLPVTTTAKAKSLLWLLLLLLLVLRCLLGGLLLLVLRCLLGGLLHLHLHLRRRCCLSKRWSRVGRRWRGAHLSPLCKRWGGLAHHIEAQIEAHIGKELRLLGGGGGGGGSRHLSGWWGHRTGLGIWITCRHARHTRHAGHTGLAGHGLTGHWLAGHGLWSIARLLRKPWVIRDAWARVASRVRHGPVGRRSGEPRLLLLWRRVVSRLWVRWISAVWSRGLLRVDSLGKAAL